ncbi:MAG: prohibitin family protein [Cytophagales bacterium]|nr:MAG: prohibitin family protein [Cytophagales bacterium]
METKLVKIIAVLFIGLLSSCTIVRQGEVGVKRTLGKLQPNPYLSGVVGFNPFISAIIKVPTRTVNVEIRLSLPSKEGLNVQSEISILYHIVPKEATNVIEKIGPNYEDVVIISVFRSAAADVCSKYLAKDMHTAERGFIEKEISTKMSSLLTERGFVIEAVLLKSISLPAGLSRSIEEKLQAEQDAQRMEFILNKEKQEAERRRIEAAGIRDAQKIIAEGLSDKIIEYNSIQAFEKLSQSNNAKVIVTDGKAPLLIGGNQ